MIHDVLDNLTLYLPVTPLFRTLLDFVARNDLACLDLGRTTISKGIYASISEYNTKDLSDSFIECHRNFIDIHLVVEGCEAIGICNKGDCRISKEYDKEKDIEKLEGDVDFITLRKKNFAVFFPHDGHAPGLKTGKIETKVRKIVFKVPA